MLTLLAYQAEHGVTLADWGKVVARLSVLEHAMFQAQTAFLLTGIVAGILIGAIGMYHYLQSRTPTKRVF